MSYTPPLLRTVADRGYVVFRGDHYDLNLVIIRRATDPDDLAAIYRVSGAWHAEWFRCQSMPTPQYLMEPLNDEGCAILAPGQHRGAWAVGWHKGRPALSQTGAPVLVYRDDDRDELPEITGEPVRGYFGINVHDPIGYSAGCVTADTSTITRLIELVNEQSRAGFGDSVSLTILDGSR